MLQFEARIREVSILRREQKEKLLSDLSTYEDKYNQLVDKHLKDRQYLRDEESELKRKVQALAENVYSNYIV